MENQAYRVDQQVDREEAAITFMSSASSSSDPIHAESPFTLPLTDEELKEICQTFTKDFCCYGTRFIREMNLMEIQNFCAFHYKLESLGEKRESVRRSIIYQGEDINTGGYTVRPWDVRVATEDGMFEFKEHQVITQLPNTTYLSNCTKCSGNMTRTCGSCYGDGEKDCCNCNGRGRVRSDSDDWWSSRTRICLCCLGTGKKSCWTCGGRGKVKCKACKMGKMKNFKELIITWKPHTDDFISNTQNMPKELILEADGRELFSERENPVHPINVPYGRAINEASSHFIYKHSTSFGEEQIIAQRHSLRAVPFTKATYSWKNTIGDFYVYGTQKKVYFEDYPQTCCLCSCC